MTRIRDDYVFGTLSVEIGTGDTTLTSTGLERLSAVTAPDIAAVVLYSGDNYEIVHVTTHTAAADTATVLRGQEGTTAQAWGTGTAWRHGPTALDLTATAINAQTGTTYTLDLADAGNFVTMNNGSASTLTVPPNSSVAFPVGTVIKGAQLGAGQVTLTPGAGVTINAEPGTKVAAQYGTFALLKTGADTWLAMGRLAA